ncbi:MAG: SIS domain-containing protein [Chloroflexi bacterium]|nr:SIS domain-containing protein [Chloroflexota bacterium]
MTSTRNGVANKSAYEVYRAELKHILDEVTTENLSEVATLLRNRQRKGATVYIAGNGGSAANASHCATHLRECGIKAVCLNDSLSHLTAIGNDFGYEHVFTKGLPGGRIDPSDMVLVFSCSGRSPNILQLLKVAEANEAGRAALLGFGGGSAAAMCEAHVSARSQNYGAIEDAHSALIHVLKEVLLDPR